MAGAFGYEAEHYDVTVAARLWQASTDLVGLTAYG